MQYVLLSTVMMYMFSQVIIFSDGIITLNLDYYVRQLELYFGFIPCGYHLIH